MGEPDYECEYFQVYFPEMKVIWLNGTTDDLYLINDNLMMRHGVAYNWAGEVMQREYNNWLAENILLGIEE